MNGTEMVSLIVLGLIVLALVAWEGRKFDLS